MARIVFTVRANSEAVYGLARREGITPREAADRIVLPRLASEAP